MIEMSDLKKISALACELEDARRQESAAEVELARRAARVQDLEENLIPEAMAEAGVDAFTTSDGREISIKDFVHTAITGANKEAAHRWLEENGHGGMIKRVVSVSFNKEQGEEAKELVQRLSGDFPAVKQDQAVHASTLKAWVTRRLEDGDDFPQELFSVYVKKVAKIK